MNKNTILVIILVVLTSLIARELFPKNRDVVVPGPPSRPDTIFVQDTVIATDTLFSTRTVFSTDTVNLVQTVLIADTVRIPVGSILPVRKYVEAVEVGETLGDSTWVTGTSFASDSSGMRFVPFAQSIWTAGPFRSLRTEGDSIRIDFGEFAKDNSCGFFCRAKLVILGAATGFVIGELKP